MILTRNELAVAEQQVLLDVAEQCALSGLAGGHWCDPHAEWYPGDLRNIQACFVSLRSGDQVLGAVGTTEPQRPLVIDAARNAFDVASLVAQGTKPTEPSLRTLALEIAVLSPLRFLSASTFDGMASQLQSGSDGVFVRSLDRAATFLPTMWEEFSNSTNLLRQLCCRAKIDPRAWPSETQVATFSTQCFSRTFDEARPKPLPR